MTELAQVEFRMKARRIPTTIRAQKTKRLALLLGQVGQQFPRVDRDPSEDLFAAAFSRIVQAHVLVLAGGRDMERYSHLLRSYAFASTIRYFLQVVNGYSSSPAVLSFAKATAEL